MACNIKDFNAVYKCVLSRKCTFFVFQDKLCLLHACFERWDESEYKVSGGLTYENNETDRVKAIVKKHFRKSLDIIYAWRSHALWDEKMKK